MTQREEAENSIIMLSECPEDKLEELEQLREFIKHNPYSTVYDTEEADIDIVKFVHFDSDNEWLYQELDNNSDEFLTDQDAMKLSMESFARKSEKERLEALT